MVIVCTPFDKYILRDVASQKDDNVTKSTILSAQSFEEQNISTDSRILQPQTPGLHCNDNIIDYLPSTLRQPRNEEEIQNIEDLKRVLLLNGQYCENEPRHDSDNSIDSSLFDDASVLKDSSLLLLIKKTNQLMKNHGIAKNNMDESREEEEYQDEHMRKDIYNARYSENMIRTELERFSHGSPFEGSASFMDTFTSPCRYMGRGSGRKNISSKKRAFFVSPSTSKTSITDEGSLMSLDMRYLKEEALTLKSDYHSTFTSPCRYMGRRSDRKNISSKKRPVFVSPPTSKTSITDEGSLMSLDMISLKEKALTLKPDYHSTPGSKYEKYNTYNEQIVLQKHDASIDSDKSILDSVHLRNTISLSNIENKPIIEEK